MSNLPKTYRQTFKQDDLQNELMKLYKGFIDAKLKGEDRHIEARKNKFNEIVKSGNLESMMNQLADSTTDPVVNLLPFGTDNPKIRFGEDKISSNKVSNEKERKKIEKFYELSIEELLKWYFEDYTITNKIEQDLIRFELNDLLYWGKINKESASIGSPQHLANVFNELYFKDNSKLKWNKNLKVNNNGDYNMSNKKTKLNILYMNRKTWGGQSNEGDSFIKIFNNGYQKNYLLVPATCTIDTNGVKISNTPANIKAAIDNGTVKTLEDITSKDKCQGGTVTNALITKLKPTDKVFQDIIGDINYALDTLFEEGKLKKQVDSIVEVIEKNLKLEGPLKQPGTSANKNQEGYLEKYKMICAAYFLESVMTQLTKQYLGILTDVIGKKSTDTQYKKITAELDKIKAELEQKDAHIFSDQIYNDNGKIQEIKDTITDVQKYFFIDNGKLDETKFVNYLYHLSQIAKAELGGLKVDQSTKEVFELFKEINLNIVNELVERQNKNYKRKQINISEGNKTAIIEKYDETVKLISFPVGKTRNQFLEELMITLFNVIKRKPIDPYFFKFNKSNMRRSNIEEKMVGITKNRALLIFAIDNIKVMLKKHIGKAKNKEKDITENIVNLIIGKLYNIFYYYDIKNKINNRLLLIEKTKNSKDKNKLCNKLKIQLELYFGLQNPNPPRPEIRTRTSSILRRTKINKASVKEFEDYQEKLISKEENERKNIYKLLDIKDKECIESKNKSNQIDDKMKVKLLKDLNIFNPQYLQEFWWDQLHNFYKNKYKKEVWILVYHGLKNNLPGRKPGIYITNLFIYAKELARITDDVLETNQEGGFLGMRRPKMLRSKNKTSEDTQELIHLIGNNLRVKGITPATISNTLYEQLNQRIFDPTTREVNKGVLLVPDNKDNKLNTNIIFEDRNNTPDLVLKLLYQMIFASPILEKSTSDILDSKISTSYKEVMFKSFKQVNKDIYGLLSSNKIAKLGNEKLYKYSQKIYSSINDRNSIKLNESNNNKKYYITPSKFKEELQPEFDKLLKEKALITKL